MTKIIAMYLPQYHETEENNKWWGRGFTDWTSVKSAESLFNGHIQPKKPLGGNYYDLSDFNTINEQVALAKKYGVYGFGIYHYWFSSSQQVLTKPAEIILEHKEIDIPFFFAWDNNSWVRTWSKYKHNTNAWSPKVDAKINAQKNDDNGILAKLEYGDENDWTIHFNYLNKFFRDERYIKIDGKPILVIWNYTEKEKLQTMCSYLNRLAKESGYSGIYFISRLNPYDSMDCFDSLFTYEPMFSAWQNKDLVQRVYDKVVSQFNLQKNIKKFNYDSVWNSILNNAKKHNNDNVMYGSFVNYDDSPRRGEKGKVILGSTPDKFERYMSKLLAISKKQNKEFIFLTAWNEWGEGAYLEPDELNGYSYLEALKKAITENE
jgi:hypothetical protein